MRRSSSTRDGSDSPGSSSRSAATTSVAAHATGSGSLRRAQEEEAGLRIPSLILSDHVFDGGLADADPVTRARAADDVRTAITLAAELGADIVLVPFFLRGDLDGEEGFDRCAESFPPLCAEAASAGVTLCYEGTLPAPEIRRLAERVGSTAFGCYFDLANPLVGGLDPPTELRELGGLVRRVHFKESRTARGDARPGLGRVDYAECALGRSRTSATTGGSCSRRPRHRRRWSRVT